MTFFGRNDSCPCGSRKKHKQCCLGKVDWAEELRSGSAYQSPHLSIRGRNVAFLNAIGDALQLDTLDDNSYWGDIKRRITSQSVLKINEAILRIWPRNLDLDAALQSRDARETGFFSGDYRPDRLIKSVARHSIYADVIGLADPFVYPISMRDEYSPLLHPEMHRTNTAMNVLLWMQLRPMVEDGIVELYRLPSDFSHKLRYENLKACEGLVNRHPEVKASVEREVERRTSTDMGEHQEWMMLAQSDEQLQEIFITEVPGASVDDTAAFIREINRKRDNHPFFMPVHGEEIIVETTGASVYDAFQISQLTGAYILTDMEPKWRQIGAVSAEAGLDIADRTRVAKALDNLTVPMIDSLDLKFARRIREEGRLAGVRRLFDGIMRNSKSDVPLSDNEVRAFRQELENSIAEAGDEYRKIDEELLKWNAANGIAVAGSFAASGAALAIGLGGVAMAAVSLFWANMRRKSHSNRFPASIFLDR